MLGTSTKQTLALATSLPILVASTGVSAQENEAGLETIEVTASKRKQNIQDVTVSVSYIDGETIARQNLKDTTALTNHSPNLIITQNAAEGTPPALNIRGVGSLDYNTSTTSPVGVYLDQVGTGSANGQLINLYDIESVEVLKGPQGTLFGRNSTGGAILINTHKPIHTKEGYISAGFAERDHIDLEAMLNIPINESVATRFAINHQDYDYSITNLHPGSPEAGMRQTQGRASIKADFNKWQIFGKVYFQDWDGTVQPVGNIGVIEGFDPNTGLPTGQCSPDKANTGVCFDAFGFNDGSNDFYDVRVNNDINGGSPHESEGWGTDLQLSYQLSERSTLEIISSFGNLDRVHFFNSDGSPAGLAEGGQDVIVDLFTQEVRIQSEFENAYWIAGFYFLDEEIQQDNFIDLFRDFRAVPSLFSAAVKFNYDNQIDTRSWAVFSQVDYSIASDLKLVAGLRYTDEQVDYHATSQINIATALNDQTGLTIPGWDINGVVEDDFLSGKLALHYKPSANKSLFFSYSKGHKSGGYNGALAFSEAEAVRNDYGKETLDAYEIGGYLRFPELSATLHWNSFYYDYQDQQVFMNQAAVEPNAPPTQLLDNVGQSAIYGAELDFFWQPATQWETRFTAGYLPEAELESFVNASGEEIRDNRLPFTPKWSLTGNLDYSMPLQDGELGFHIDVNYKSRYYFDQNQNPYASQSGYSVWNARVSYEFEQWTAALWGKNLFAKQYSHLRFDLVGLLGMLQDFKADDRQVGIEIKYAFD